MGGKIRRVRRIWYKFIYEYLQLLLRPLRCMWFGVVHKEGIFLSLDGDCARFFLQQNTEHACVPVNTGRNQFPKYWASDVALGEPLLYVVVKTFRLRLWQLIEVNPVLVAHQIVVDAKPLIIVMMESIHAVCDDG